MNYFINLFELNKIFNVYSALIGVFIAFIIYIVETIRDYKDLLKKKVVLYYIRIDKIIIITLIILLLMFVYGGIGDSILYQTIFGTICTLSVFGYGILLYKTYKEITKYNYDIEYYEKKKKEYIESIISTVNKKNYNIQNNSFERDNIELNNYILSNSFISNKIKATNDYIPIKAVRGGIVSKIKYDEIDNINKLVQKVYEEKNLKNILIINFKIGENITKDQIIFYCHKVYYDYYRDINLYINYYDFNRLGNEEMNKNNRNIKDIIYGLINKEMEVNQYKYDSSIFDLYSYLYKNELYNIIKQSIFCFSEYFYSIDVNENSLKKYIIILNHIKFFAIYYNDIESYKNVNELIISTYKRLLYVAEDKKQVAFDFYNEVKSNTFKPEDNYYIYAHELDNLLIIIVELLNNKMYDELNVIINNYSKFDNYDGKYRKKDIIDFQFIIGIVIAIVTLHNENKIDDIKIINRLIDLLKYRFYKWYSLYDSVKLIDYSFYFNTPIKETYFRMDLYIVDHRYKNSFYGYANSIESAFFNIITLLDIKYIHTNKKITSTKQIDLIKSTINSINAKSTNIQVTYEKIGKIINLDELKDELNSLL